eukprot:Platyproteum_vivax@DN2388_c0_g1_i1.p1
MSKTLDETGNALRQQLHATEDGRAIRLLKQRKLIQENALESRNILENETKKMKISTVDQRFGGSGADRLEEQFRQETIGLVSVDEFREKRKRIDELIQQDANNANKNQKVLVSKRGKLKTSALSFDAEAEDEGCSASNILQKKHLGKDPTIDTEFLRDPEREAEVARQRQELINKYALEEERSKDQLLEVVYSYWDGSGHRRSMQIPKGATIHDFLEKCRHALVKEFPELLSVPTESLMYIKEDLILPHRCTFYSLMKSGARGKNGPLFDFNVEVGIKKAQTVEKDGCSFGKIVDKKWYERNKHIYPASTWEHYDGVRTY